MLGIAQTHLPPLPHYGDPFCGLRTPVKLDMSILEETFDERTVRYAVTSGVVRRGEPIPEELRECIMMAITECAAIVDRYSDDNRPPGERLRSILVG
jgi:hypothetical protein